MFNLMRNTVLKVIPLFTVLIVLSLSCASYTVKDSNKIKKVDKKILSEFYESVESAEFYEACKSYIEFTNCCSDSRKDEMTDELTRLYHAEIASFKDAGSTLDAIEYTYSFINITSDSMSDEESNKYRKDLLQYIQKFVTGELTNRGDLEKASWLIYLTQFLPDDPFLYKELSELFLERNNLLMTKKYYDLFISLVNEEGLSEFDKESEELKDKIQKLQNEVDQSNNKNFIESTIKSSVKIFVDRGIKTEYGVGKPDHVIGTGVVIDEQGYIITNYHIIESSVDPKYEGYSRVYVIPGKDENIRFVAKIVGYDSVFDLALLKIEKRLESYIRLGDSDTLHQGEKVIAIGNPIGLTNTVTSGIISSLDRPFFQIGNIVQIDAALNPGNSGGALINNDGYLIGIAFAGLESFENLNFAIPSNLMLSVLFRLYEGGEVERSWVGCFIAKQYDRLVIDYIVPDSPANIFRLVKGDVISHVNGRPVNGIYDVQTYISQLNNPLITRITVERGNEIQERNVLIEKRPVFPSLYIYEHDTYENVITPLFGIVVDKVEPPITRSYIVSRIVSSSIASSIGISEGDEIKVREIKYDEESKVFYLIIDLKSKRFGYMNKNMIIYSNTSVNSFV